VPFFLTQKFIMAPTTSGTKKMSSADIQDAIEALLAVKKAQDKAEEQKHKMEREQKVEEEPKRKAEEEERAREANRVKKQKVEEDQNRAEERKAVEDAVGASVRVTPLASPPFGTLPLSFAVFGCRFAPEWLWSEPSPTPSPLSLFGGLSFLCSHHAVHICVHLGAVWGWSLGRLSDFGSDASAA
jgi:hypothetical protein